MKINLLYNSRNFLSGFINIDPLATPDQEKNISLVGNIDNLDWIVENSECTNIVAEDVLNCFHGETVDNILENWARKLRHKGILIISGVDIFELSRGISNRYIDIVDANLLLYGQNGEKKSVLSAVDLCNALKSLGLKINKVRYNSYRYTIEAERP